MATLPQSIDYGARPSLRSRRIDQPDQSGLIIADALGNAADTFAKVMVERKGKQDALAYANAKSELLAEDIRLRRLLEDDQDHATYEERYRLGMKKARDRITPIISNNHDRAIFDADANLTVERGVSAVAEIGRVRRIDEENANLVRAMEQGKDDLLAADPATRNDILLNILAGISASERKGNLTDIAAEKMRQDFVKDVAVAELTTMDPLDREEALESSITANPSKDKIKAGEGSGSLADFLHQDEKIEMLRRAQLENKTGRDRTAAFAVVDAAFEKFPLATQASDRAKYIREHTKGDIRAVAESSLSSRNTAMFREESALRTNTMRSQATLLEEAADDPDKHYTYDDIPASELARLGANEKETLRKYWLQLEDDQEFAERTNWDEWGRWQEMTDIEKAGEDLTSPFWKTTVEGHVWRSMFQQQEQINSGGITQDQGMTDDQLLQTIVVGGDILPKTKLSPDENAAYQRLRFRFRDEVKGISDAEFGGGKVPYQRRRDTLLKILGEQAWRRDRGIFGFDASLDEPEALFKLSPEQMKAGFIPISIVRNQETKVSVAGTLVTISWEQRLINLAKERLDGRVPNEKDIENAYFAVRAGMSDQEVLRRLAGKGDY